MTHEAWHMSERRLVELAMGRLLGKRCTSSIELCEYGVLNKQVSFNMAMNKIYGTFDCGHSELWSLFIASFYGVTYIMLWSWDCQWYLTFRSWMGIRHRFISRLGLFIQHPSMVSLGRHSSM